MRRVPYGELEIVGFSEAVKDVPCARVPPVVRHISEDNYFPLLAGDAAGAEVDDWWTGVELESLRVENHVTLLPESGAIPAFPSAMMVYATSALVAATGSELAESFDGEELHKWTLTHNGGEVLVICASSKAIEGLMNGWAGRLMGMATRRLEQFFSYKGKGLPEEAEKVRIKAEALARMARSAAIDRTLRSRALIRLGVALLNSETPERWENIRAMVLRTFPGGNSETLDKQLALLVKSLRAQVSQNDEDPPGKGARNIGNEIIKNVISIVQETDEKKRRRMARIYTREHRELHPLDEAILSYVEEKLVQQGSRYDPWIYLEDHKLVLALAGEEALYSPDVFIELSNGPAINLVGFLRKIKRGGLMLAGVDDLMDAASLAGKLKAGPDPLSRYIRGRLSATTIDLLDQYQPPHQPSHELKESLVDEFNKLINGTSLYEGRWFANVRLEKETQELIGKELQGLELRRLNRMLLEDAYPREIARNLSPVAHRVQMAAAQVRTAAAGG